MDPGPFTGREPGLDVVERNTLAEIEYGRSISAERYVLAANQVARLSQEMAAVATCRAPVNSGLALARSVQLRGLEELVAGGAEYPHLVVLAVSHDGERHRDARLAHRPDVAEELDEAADRLPVHCEHLIAHL